MAPPLTVDWRLLDGVRSADRDRVLAATVRRRYAKGDALVREGEPGDTVHLIEQGTVVIEKATPTGQTVAVDVIGPGNVFGEQSLLAEGHHRTATVRALEDVTTLTLRRGEFTLLRDAHPSVDRFLVALLSDRLRELGLRLQEALHASVDTRITRRLAELARMYGTVIPLNQGAVAALAGTSRPTCNSALQDLAVRGIIAIKRGRIEVLDHERLDAEAERFE